MSSPFVLMRLIIGNALFVAVAFLTRCSVVNHALANLGPQDENPFKPGQMLYDENQLDKKSL